MSQPTPIPVTCPACSAPGQFPAWESLNVTADPSLKTRLLSGQLLTFLCPACQIPSPMAYDLLYHDMTAHAMFWLIHSPEPLDQLDPLPPLQKTYTRRRVRTVDELLEKIRLLDDRYDDRLMELFKLALFASLSAQSDEQAKPTSPLLYAGTTNAGLQTRLRFTYHTPQGHRAVLIDHAEQFAPFARSHASPLPPLPPDPWPEINMPWALQTTPH